MAALVHLVCGPTGAGKTTLAVRLADELKAVRFSIDEWMTALFWKDSPRPIEFGWTIERVGRCEAQIWATAMNVAARGVPVVLDLGFTTADHRARFRAFAREAGFTSQVHVADAPVETRWQRVEARNAQKGPTFQFEVTREMFLFIEEMWEPPTAAELQPG
jgi:predicted kinase